jgi:hypothetical protein
MCADELIGGTKAKDLAWNRIYRAIEHRTAKQALLTKDAASIAPSIAAFGRAFADLQEKRHEADYNPIFFAFFFDETRAQVELARKAISDLNGLGLEQRQTLATLILFRPRAGVGP